MPWLGAFLWWLLGKFKRKVIPGDVLVIEVKITKQRGPIGFGYATASVDGEVAVVGEIKFAIGK